MANPNAVVSRVLRIEPPLERVALETLHAIGAREVELEDGRRIRLDPDDPRYAGFAQVLDGLRIQRMPVYLELDPASSTISRLLIPYVARVVSVRSGERGALDIQLAPSHARHLLRRDNADFAEFERQLLAAQHSGDPLIVTDDEAHNVIDVRAFRPGPDAPPPPPPWPAPWPPSWLRDRLNRLWHWHGWPWWWFRCISWSRAQQVFDAMSATTCDPLTVPPLCIPFLYPDDGCWGRAHEMCRLMIAMGLSPGKVWIEGWLAVSTRNNPSCMVHWGWHVAPTLCVRRPGFLRSREMVIDPALFTTPVTRSSWKSVQGDPNASLTSSSASVFHLWGNETDPTYAKTNGVLARYRLELQSRAVQHGAPPYAHCP